VPRSAVPQGAVPSGQAQADPRERRRGAGRGGGVRHRLVCPDVAGVPVRAGDAALVAVAHEGVGAESVVALVEGGATRQHLVRFRMTTIGQRHDPAVVRQRAKPRHGVAEDVRGSRWGEREGRTGGTRDEVVSLIARGSGAALVIVRASRTGGVAREQGVADIYRTARRPDTATARATVMLRTMSVPPLRMPPPALTPVVVLPLIVSLPRTSVLSL